MRRHMGASGTAGVAARRAGALGALLLVIGLAGCGQAVAPSESSSSSTSGAQPSDPSGAPSGQVCAVASAAAIAAVNDTVVAKGKGNSVPKLTSWADPAARAWWLVGVIAGPTGGSDAVLGMWSTASDPTQESFSGAVYAIDGGAQGLSTAPINTIVTLNPDDVPAIGCWDSKES